jgi:predicted lipase
MDKNTALMCAEICQATYIDRFDGIKSFQLTARFENKGTDTQGYFGIANGDTFVIAFRGSEETGIADWLTDLKFAQQVFPYEESNNKKVKVHYGFIWAYKSVRDAVRKAAKETPLKKILCTGHSLGAGLATLCALDVQYNNPDKQVSCYTFGSPKVGNNDFVESYNHRVPNTFRLVNKNDLIPNLPPLGYLHTGQLVNLGESSSLQLNLADLVKLKEMVLQKMEDHFPRNYIQAVRDFLK